MTTLKPWREIAVPHPDVLEGTFQQSEFAADISAVRNGRAPREYQVAEAFFERTYITEGMRLLLTQVAQRLMGQGGEPVIQLQTAFGGGKTHTMLAVFHLATRPGSLNALAGIPALLDRAGLMGVPKARVAILDGTQHAPGQPWTCDGHVVRTLWGELAWQLGGAEGYALLAGADATGTSPAKEVLRELLAANAPCVVLIDELVAYIRQFGDGQALSGGTYNSNLSFVQALTEATKLVPNAIVLGSLPESEVEAGDSRGVAALKALEKTFGRVQALWKPVATEEAFEIVRRRLFEPVRDSAGRDAVCGAFAQAYRDEGARLPSETHEARYAERLVQAYPIHPEVFDRLYEDWATLEGFQRTRGVLKLMARVIYRLWKDQSSDLMILPGGLPLYDGGVRNELVYHLAPGWDPVIERDVDGERAESWELEQKEPRFGAVSAARRVARTIFFATAPSATIGARVGVRGLDRARVVLGCLQPGQGASVFVDALGRLADRLHYLSASGDRTEEATRFWFDTRANLRREMEDRKARFDDKREVQTKARAVLEGQLKPGGMFDGVHVFTPSAEVPDDSALRLVLLEPRGGYSRQEPRATTDKVIDHVRQHGAKPRFRGNRLVFLAPDAGGLARLRDAVRTALAWASIVADIKAKRLVVDQLQADQAESEGTRAGKVAEQAVRECYRWVLCPLMEAPTDRELVVEAFAVNTAGAAFMAEVERVCRDNELVISAWSPIHLRTQLQQLYWKEGQAACGALAVWEDTQKYLYLPRLQGRPVFDAAVTAGARSEDFFGTANGEEDGRYVGFGFGQGGVQVDGTLLLIAPEAARAYRERCAAEQAARDAAKAVLVSPDTASGEPDSGRDDGGAVVLVGRQGDPLEPLVGPVAKRTWFCSVDVPAASARMRLLTLAEELIEVLASDPHAQVRVTLEVDARFPTGVPDHVRRAVDENVVHLGIERPEWE